MSNSGIKKDNKKENLNLYGTENYMLEITIEYTS